MRQIVLATLLVLVLGSSAAFADTFTVGVLQSLTGLAAEDGKTVIQALNLAAEEINAKEDLKIKLTLEDDQSAPKSTVSGWHKLAAPQPEAIIGATWDFTSNAVLPLAAQSRIVIFNTSSLPESLNLDQAQGFGFTNAQTVSSEAHPFTQFLQMRGPRTTAIIYANNSWGETQFRTYSEIVKAQRVEILAEAKPVRFDENEWREIVLRIKEKRPESVLLLLNKNDLRLFLRRAKEVKWETRFFASKNAFDAIQADSEKQLYEGLCFTYPLARLKTEVSFAERYKRKFGEEPRIYADNTYDALMILHRAAKISRAKSITLKDALPEVVHDGLVGRYAFDPAHSFSIGTASLVCQENGQLRLGLLNPK